MPELPEVETTLRGIQPLIEGQTIQQFMIRVPRLRWPIPRKNLQELIGHKINQVKRRGKYLLLITDLGAIILHFGMSGRLCILDSAVTANKHDHADIVFNNGNILRFTDPRRFGALLWTNEPNPLSHPLLKKLGVEPLSRNFTPHFLQRRLHTKNLAIKAALMDQHIVVGIGNIYITEALFTAGIHPATSAKTLSLMQLKRLITAVKTILRRAIKKGGTTLKDFLNSQGKPGYFKQALQVYGRAGLPCLSCQTSLQSMRIGQRSTVYCSYCQAIQQLSIA